MENKGDKVEKVVHIYQVDRQQARVHLGVMAVLMVLLRIIYFKSNF